MDEATNRNGGLIRSMHNSHLELTAEKRLLLFSGSGYPELAEKIAERLDVSLGEVQLTQFSGGEMYARYEQSIRGADVFIVQSLGEPVNEKLMELLVMVDAARRASAESIVAVIPWFAYSRQDRKTKPREPITARLVANMIQVAGADRVMTMDLHVGQIEGFFSFPVDHLTAMHTFVDYFVDQGFRDAEDAVVVAPDTGEVKVAKRLADHLGLPWAIVNKLRRQLQQSEVTHVIGDVDGKRAIMIDDIIDTGGTTVRAAESLFEEGAVEVYAAATHPVLSGPAYERIEDSPIKEVVVTDTLPLKRGEPHEKIHTLTIAPILANTIRNVFSEESVSEVFMGENQLF
jgi:ribose-phosphate pyrophosphokinase